MDGPTISNQSNFDYMPNDPLPPFPGFRKDALKFLADLNKNNDRDWFKARKSTFDDEVMWPLKCLVADVAKEVQSRGLQLNGDPKGSIFRIYRDVRFSKNKDPYKTHVAAVLSPSGKKDDPGGIYIHVEPKKCFLAAGYWNPEKNLLARIRESIASKPEVFLGIVKNAEKAGMKLTTHDSLKRMPRGFEDYADSPTAEYLKWKGYIITQDCKEADIQKPEFTQQVADFAVSVRPALEFGWELMGK